MWLWLLSPLRLIYSDIPLALSWSGLVGWWAGGLVGWSVIRL